MNAVMRIAMLTVLLFWRGMMRGGFTLCHEGSDGVFAARSQGLVTCPKPL
ncbi:hypothetical protein C7964_10415 [Loktanella sp. PT4BL]|nr:hypothetical protein C7964_10415 [Loktanella sp. PT4BL]